MKSPNWPIRLAVAADVPALEVLIPLSVHALQADCYTRAQRDAALGPVFGVDRQLIADGTYFVVTEGPRIIGCGGWSRRESLFGGDDVRSGEDALLDPAKSPARVRAFFVHPDWTRRGIGRSILQACEQAIRSAGFCSIELVATLPGEGLYAAAGYAVVERYEIPLTGMLKLPAVKMNKGL